MLIKLLRRAARNSPERPVTISAGRSQSYAECLARSEAVGRGLRTRGIDRFGVSVADHGDTLVALAASSAIGAEACTYPRELDAQGVSTLASALGHSVVATDRDLALDGAAGVALSRLVADGGDLAPAPRRAPVLILTTGTTGDRKGTRHEWSRLVRGVRHPDGRPARWLLAYDLNQFGGVQILLHVLASAGTLVAPPSRRPQDLIETIHRTGVTHVSATPTFWRLLVAGLRAGTAPEPALEQITLGGEAVPGTLIDELRGMFPTARLSQVYAASEFGTAVSVHDNLSGLPLSVLERDDDADVRLRIVEGELQVRSRIGMLGYHHGRVSDEKWRATGDLVEVRDGRIHFVGRRNEVINVGGAKVLPLPIEALLCSIDGVEMAAVYGRPNPVTGQIVVADVVATPGSDPEKVEAAIRAACVVLPRAGRPRRLRFVPALEVRGDKVVRTESGSGR